MQDNIYKRLSIQGHLLMRRLVSPGIYLSLRGITLFCSMILISCSSGLQSSTSHPTPTGIPATTLSLPGNKVINTLVPTVGCGKASPIPAGSSSNEAIPANPVTSRGHHTRSYRIHVPATYTASQPQAVVLVFHGHGGNATETETATGFSQLADQDNFIVVYPQGLLDDSGLPFWASIGPIDYGIDDALFMSDLLTKLQTDLCVDPHRIYVTGFSNGGGMSGFLACKLAGRIAASAPISGNYYDLPGGCQPGRAVPILEIHGTADSIVPYAGIPASENPIWHLPSIPQWLQNWASRDGCRQGPIIFLHTSLVTGEQWINCKSNVNVVHYRIENGGHALPATIGSASTSATIWHFFQAHPFSST